VNRALVTHDAPDGLDRLDAPLHKLGSLCSSETVLAGEAVADQGDGAPACLARCAGPFESEFTRAHEGTTLPLSRDRECGAPAASPYSSATASPVATPPVALLTLSAARAATCARGQQVGNTNTGAGSAWTGTGGRRHAA
jgi:hypothetical protein